LVVIEFVECVDFLSGCFGIESIASDPVEKGMGEHGEVPMTVDAEDPVNLEVVEVEGILQLAVDALDLPSQPMLFIRK